MSNLPWKEGDSFSLNFEIVAISLIGVWARSEGLTVPQGFTFSQMGFAKPLVAPKEALIDPSNGTIKETEDSFIVHSKYPTPQTPSSYPKTLAGLRDAITEVLEGLDYSHNEADVAVDIVEAAYTLGLRYGARNDNNS